MYLIDTDICIFAIKAKDESLLRTVREKSGSPVFVSSLTVAELEFGVSNSIAPERNRLALMKFISLFDIINFDENDAIAYGMIKTDLREKGMIIGPIDMLLAAQAVSRKLIMVTNNVREFGQVQGLVIEDWSRS